MIKTVERKYHYFYKITNNINGNFYYGIHSTDNLNDGYMGSGTRLHKAYDTFGIENFTKEILKFFDTRKELSEYEAAVVTEHLVADMNCYNSILGGENGGTYRTATVKNKLGEVWQLPCNDPRIQSGEFVGVTKENITCFDSNSNTFVHISKTEYDNNPERYCSILNNNIIVLDLLSKTTVMISKDEYYSDQKQYVGQNKGKILVKNKRGECFLTDVNDSRIQSGEVTLFWKGRKHRPETIAKQKDTMKQNKHQQGNKNSQSGTCWVIKDGISKKIHKTELDTYINNGWIKGRKIKK